MTLKQESSMSNDKGYYSVVNDHTVVQFINDHGDKVYVCIECEVRGPYPEAFEDISSCDN